MYWSSDGCSSDLGGVRSFACGFADMRRPLRRGIGGRADAFARDFSGFLQAVRHRRYSSTRFALPLVSAASRKERRKKRPTPCPVGLASRGRRLLLGCTALFPGLRSEEHTSELQSL